MDTCAWGDSKYWWEVSFDEGVMVVVAYDAFRAKGADRPDPVIDDTINPADVTSIKFIHNDEGAERPARSYPEGCSYIILRCRNPTYGEWEYKWRMEYMGSGVPEHLVEGLDAFLSTSKSQVVPKQLADLQRFAHEARGDRGNVEYQPVDEVESGQGATAHFEFTSVKKRNTSMPNGPFLTLIVVSLVISIPLGIALSVLLGVEMTAIWWILGIWMMFLGLVRFLKFLREQFILWRGSGTPVGTEVWIEGSTIRVAHNGLASDVQGSPLVLPLGCIDSVRYVDSHKNG